MHTSSKLNFRIFQLVVITLLGCAYSGDSQSLDQIIQRQESRLEDATSRLTTLRTEIQNEQIPLGKKLTELREEAKSYKEEILANRKLRDNASLSLEQLDTLVKTGKKELDYISGSLFNEFESSLKAALSPGELATYGEELRLHDLSIEGKDELSTENLSSSLEMLQLSMERLEGLIGGKNYPGKAIGPEGVQLDGTFVQVGPLNYFSSQSNSVVGWVEETKTFQPKVRPVAKSEAESIRLISETGVGNLPIDPTLGDAIAIAETKETWQEHLKKGGIWVLPIMIFAAISMVVAIYKSLQVFLIRHPKPLVVHDIVKMIRNGDVDGALTLASAQPEPAASMLVEGVKNSQESIELVEEVMYESILSAQPRLERFLNVIAVTAATAPLLGLLGTVTGIIKTFKLMEIFGAGDPKPLISGISEALITTELGLVLAIPALISHALLSRRVTGILSQMEKLSIAFINGLSRKSTAIKTK